MSSKQTIAIDLLATCNATCEHCCFCCSPQSHDILNERTVHKIIDDVCKQDTVETVGFTGGEALLHRNQTLAYIRQVKQAGKKPTLVSNGFWGITKKSSETMFNSLEKAGLHSMTISYEDFHAKYIPIQRIKNTFAAAHHSRVKIILNMAVSKSYDSSKLILDLGETAYGVPITRYPVVPCGRAANMADKEFIKDDVNSLDMHYPGFQLLYHHNGLVSTCEMCRIIFKDPDLIGNIKSDVEAYFDE